MENEQATSNAISSSNRPIISLPLGLALLLIFLFCMSTLLTCWLNWHKLRALLGSSNDTDGRDVPIDIAHLPVEAAGATDHAEKMIRKTEEQSRPVVMAGDRVPKFIAITCPCEPPVAEKLTVKRAEAKPSTFPVVPVPLALYL